MKIKAPFLIVVFFAYVSCNNTKEEHATIMNDFDYPESSELINFNKKGEGVLTLVKEIDVFDGTSIPVGEIVSIDTLGDAILLADVKQNIIHVLDRRTNQYILGIGSSGNAPDQLHRVFGVLSWNGRVMVGNGQGPFLFKSFSSKGQLIQNFKNDLPLSLGVAGDLNSFFIADSIAYLVKQFADNGKKVARYRIKDQAEKIEDEIVPVSDLHKSQDSATMSNIITKMFLLKSNLKKEFYVVPNNKFLVNSYTMDGELKSSVNLMSIPIVQKYLNQIKGYANSFFSSVAIDTEDNLYIPAQEILDYEAFIRGKALAPEDLKLYILSINVDKHEYFVNKFELGMGSGLAPLKVLDDKIWCYDYLRSQIVIYQLPKR